MVAYSQQNKYLSTYSINGTFLFNEEEDCKFLLSPIVFSDMNFNDFLVKIKLIRFMEQTREMSK